MIFVWHNICLLTWHWLIHLMVHTIRHGMMTYIISISLFPRRHLIHPMHMVHSVTMTAATTWSLLLWKRHWHWSRHLHFRFMHWPVRSLCMHFLFYIPTLFHFRFYWLFFYLFCFFRFFNRCTLWHLWSLIYWLDRIKRLMFTRYFNLNLLFLYMVISFKYPHWSFRCPCLLYFLFLSCLFRFSLLYFFLFFLFHWNSDCFILLLIFCFRWFYSDCFIRFIFHLLG